MVIIKRLETVAVSQCSGPTCLTCAATLTVSLEAPWSGPPCCCSSAFFCLCRVRRSLRPSHAGSTSPRHTCVYPRLTRLRMAICSHPKSDGYVQGTGPIMLEAYFDFLCPDSKASWSSVSKLVSVYPGNLTLNVHTFPLPYHHNAFLFSQAAHTTSISGTPGRFFDWLDVAFMNQEAFWNDATTNLSVSDVVGQIADLAASKVAGVSRATFLSEFERRTTDLAARASWKYGCSRAVTGTPTFFINGVMVPEAQPTWTVGDWQKVIDPLL